jgi:hypothetical protein
MLQRKIYFVIFKVSWRRRFSWRYFGLSRRVVWLVKANISEKRAVSIFISAVKMEPANFSETFGFYQPVHTRLNPPPRIIKNICCSKAIAHFGTWDRAMSVTLRHINLPYKRLSTRKRVSFPIANIQFKKMWRNTASYACNEQNKHLRAAE